MRTPKIEFGTPTQKQIDDLIKWSLEYDAYMQQEVHEGDCHCARCMSEFLLHTNKKG